MKAAAATAAFAVLLVTSVGLTACGADASPAPGAAGAVTARASAAQSASTTRYPVDVRNCGRTLHFDRAPTRVVSGWTTNTELLIELGLTHRIVGQYNTSSGTPAAKYAATEAKIPVLAKGAPSREALLAARPDLIWADGSYLFDGQQLPTIDDLRADGIQVLILDGFCTDDATRAAVRDVDTTLTSLGTIFGAQTAASRIRADIDRRLEGVAASVRSATPTPIAMISAFQGAVYTYDGVYSDIARLAGARNIYAGSLPAGKYFSELSVEDLIRKNPGTLVYLLSGGESEAKAREYLTARFPTVQAVRSGRISFLPQSDSTNLAGVDGVTTLATALRF
ncbi:ABC transporter substrate-binding protein [Frankia sp. AgPm24]|uniref:ABC transporter substrate-binding protein n=1 Tax=Frankia sp. AgPm24 TaxID=631128 RepID=UPI00200D752C|nr:ABC transporter substrate-binding protein [Frankia sp. AgPm24]MCK9921749.1 ABC transporter substrate-binding protein [Frankia sp. AgPm24]